MFDDRLYEYECRHTWVVTCFDRMIDVTQNRIIQPLTDMQTLRANERCIRMDNSSKSKTYDNQIRTQRQQAHSIHEWKKSRLNYMGQK